MDWLKKKKERAYEKKMRLIRGRSRGTRLLEELIKCCDGKSNPIKFFSPDQIIKATDSFSESNHLFYDLDDFEYKWYSGKTENHQKVLIEKVMMPFFNWLDNTGRNIAISSMVSGHKNFLKLVGCCLEFEDAVMVYHGLKKHKKLVVEEQPWIRRIKIAEDIATALVYLHTAFQRPFVYANLNVRNIMLDEDGVAKLFDFSCCVSIPQGKISVRYEGGDIGASYGIMEPNFRAKNLISEKMDVFGIGVLMINLLSGIPRFEDLYYESEEIIDSDSVGMHFPVWPFKSKGNRRMEDIADPGMVEKMGGVSKEELCRMESFLMLSKRCFGLYGQVPTMLEVCKELKKLQRCLKITSSSSSASSSGETQSVSVQDNSSSVLSNT